MLSWKKEKSRTLLHREITHSSSEESGVRKFPIINFTFFFLCFLFFLSTIQGYKKKTRYPSRTPRQIPNSNRGTNKIRIKLSFPRIFHKSSPSSIEEACFHKITNSFRSLRNSVVIPWHTSCRNVSRYFSSENSTDIFIFHGRLPAYKVQAGPTAVAIPCVPDNWHVNC